MVQSFISRVFGLSNIRNILETFLNAIRTLYILETRQITDHISFMHTNTRIELFKFIVRHSNVFTACSIINEIYDDNMHIAVQLLDQ